MKVLIIKLGALGDVVMATPLIEAIQIAHPGAQIQLLTTPAFAPIFHAWQNLHVHAFPRRGWRAMIDIIGFVRRGNFDRIYDLQGNDRTSIVCALSGAAERVGNHTRFPYTHHPSDKWRGNMHIFERMKRVLQSADVSVGRQTPILPTTTDERQNVENWLATHNPEQHKLVGFHASASAGRAEKCWPYFVTLAKRLLTQGINPVWLGAGEDEKQNTDFIRRSGGINASGAFSIPELALCGEHFSFAVTNDSGPMHVLAASGIPVYGLFGPSDWRRNHALGQEDHVIKCPDGSAKLEELSVEQVWQRLIADQRVSSDRR